MSEPRFTSGPWKIEYGALRDPQDMLISADEYGIAKVWNVAAGKSSENIANAHLIAAAPDMYEALIEALNFLDNGDHNDEPLMQKLRAALAKAEGRS